MERTDHEGCSVLRFLVVEQQEHVFLDENSIKLKSNEGQVSCSSKWVCKVLVVLSSLGISSS